MKNILIYLTVSTDLYIITSFLSSFQVKMDFSVIYYNKIFLFKLTRGKGISALLNSLPIFRIRIQKIKVALSCIKLSLLIKISL